MFTFYGVYFCAVVSVLRALVFCFDLIWIYVFGLFLCILICVYGHLVCMLVLVIGYEWFRSIVCPRECSLWWGSVLFNWLTRMVFSLVK